jgi:DNA-binding MarR family transcriptional regulator
MPRPKKTPTPAAAPEVVIAAASKPTAEPTTKSAAVVAHLQREQGATLAELVAATGWQPHTARAMLTGLRKKGHAIERRKRDDVSCYHLPVVSA